ncbi:MAG: KTSC domain-containing protein [Fibromonadales bacterium]|nr:KTSC domain-containing protein [Fibromonadales bacterium]
MVNIMLWELFKRLVKPNTLTAALKRMSQGQLEKIISEAKSEQDIRDLADTMNEAGENPAFNKWHHVVSTNVYGIAYDDSRHILYVAFNDKDGGGPGKVYSYNDVSEATFYSFLYSPSKGQFVWVFLRGARLGGSAKDAGKAKGTVGGGNRLVPQYIYQEEPKIKFGDEL